MTLFSRRALLGGGLALPILAGAPQVARATTPAAFAAPIALELERVWLGVSVEGLPAEPFILDTGAFESAISDSWAEQVKLRERGSSGIRGIGGTERTSVLRVENVVIGGTFRIPYMEFHGTKTFDQTRFRGIIGAGLLTDQDCDLDFVKKEWRIYPDGRSERFDLHAIPGGYFARGHVDFLSMPAQIGDFTGRFALDTGAPRNMIVDGRASRALGWWDSDRPYVPQSSRGFGKGNLPTRTYRADKVRLHKFAFPQPLITLSKPGLANGDFEGIDGLVGLHMIRHFHLSTDPKARQLWAAPNGLSFAGTERYPMSGLWLDHKGERFYVEDVGTGSPAAAVGLQVGDKIVGMEWDALLARLSGKPGDLVALDYERGGQRKRAEFTLKPYL